ncbi:MAG TPA: hypothetical protein VLI45_04405, partial [Acidobacteriaceae bacterium]|nr:hypothetical protein [Acidobacteriaceae bacterium]
STAFMRIVRTLDSHYVALGNSALKSTDKIVNGVLKSGAFPGKRILFIQGGSEAGVFMPFDSPDTAIGSDLIKINSGAPDFELIRTIAHEATHAFRYVTGASAPKDPLLGDDKPEKVEAVIQAGVTDELETRKSEIKITEGLYGKGSKERSKLQQEVKAGYLSRPLIERDIAPEIGLTYLENSGFGALLEEARLTEHLSQEQATQLREKIDTGHMKRMPTTKDKAGFEEPSRYALIYKDRQIAIATWQQFKQQFQDRMDSEEAQKEKERILQENAHILLGNRIHYSPLPKS